MNSNSLPIDLYTSTYNIEKAINEVFNYQTREELSYEVQEMLDSVMFEVHDMRRTIKNTISEEDKKRVENLKG